MKNISIIIRRSTGNQTILMIQLIIRTYGKIYNLYKELHDQVNNFIFNVVTYLKMTQLSRGAYGKIYDFNRESVVKKTKFIDENGIFNCNLREVCFYAYVKNKFNMVEYTDISIKDSIFSITLKKMKDDLHNFIVYKDLHTRVNKFNSIFFNVVKSLYYMHKNGMVHGDIKPLNILIDEKEDVGYICDFGSVQFEKESIFTNKTTLLYCPEKLDNEYKVSQSNDIYSLGYTMIHYIYGHDMVEIDKSENNTRIMLEYISKNYSPSLSVLISGMVREKYEERVSIDDVLRFFTDSVIGEFIIFYPEKITYNDRDVSIFLSYIEEMDYFYEHRCTDMNRREYFSIFRCIDLAIYIYSKYTSIKKVQGDKDLFKICSYLSTNIVCDFSELSDFGFEYDEIKDTVHDIFSVLKFDMYRPTVFSILSNRGISINSKREIEFFKKAIVDNIRDLDHGKILKLYDRV